MIFDASAIKQTHEFALRRSRNFLLLGFFNFLLLNWYFLGVDINCCHSHTDKTQVLFIIL